MASRGLDAERYKATLGPWAVDPDGPALLLPELSALLHGQRVWLPFLASECIAHPRWLGSAAHLAFAGGVLTASDPIQPPETPIDAVYFGVPTIVRGNALFGAAGWDKATARAAAREVTALAIVAGARLIVSGLGSGDIDVTERLRDMGGGEVVCMKRFIGFDDWILARWL